MIGKRGCVEFDNTINPLNRNATRLFLTAASSLRLRCQSLTAPAASATEAYLAASWRCARGGRVHAKRLHRLHY